MKGAMMATTTVRGTVTVIEAAKRLGIHHLTLYTAIREGRSPVPVIKVGRRYLIGEAALEKLLRGET
jgi:excisionase family DNA binding protein